MDRDDAAPGRDILSRVFVLPAADSRDLESSYTAPFRNDLRRSAAVWLLRRPALERSARLASQQHLLSTLGVENSDYCALDGSGYDSCCLAVALGKQDRSIHSAVDWRTGSMIADPSQHSVVARHSIALIPDSRRIPSDSLGYSTSLSIDSYYVDRWSWCRFVSRLSFAYPFSHSSRWETQKPQKTISIRVQLHCQLTPLGFGQSMRAPDHLTVKKKIHEKCIKTQTSAVPNSPTPKNMRLPMNRKIFSAYVGLDFESMHLNGRHSRNNNHMRRWETIAESENVCHDNLNLFFFIHTTIKNGQITQTYAVRLRCALADEINLIKGERELCSKRPINQSLNRSQIIKL